MDDLLQDKTQLQVRRNLRQIYPDPMTGKADRKLDLIMDKTGMVSGIRDLLGRSEPESFMDIPGKGNRYCDWQPWTARAARGKYSP